MKTKRYTKKLQRILKQEKIYHFKKDIRLLSRTKLARKLASNRGKIPMSRLMKNIIWNAYEQMEAKKAAPIRGNIRTFWYLWVKPVLSHISDDNRKKTNHYDTMLKMFKRMVLHLKLFRYSDFDFTDENWQNRLIGTARPEILVFSEKTGWVRFLRKLHKELGVSTIALGGFPSALSSEYTVEHLKEKIKTNQKIKLIGIVDYDPSGALIAEAFQDQLTSSGFPNSTLETVIHPGQGYTKKEIKMFKFKLPKIQKTKLKNWMEKTGGIYNKPYGLESESLPVDRLFNIIETLVLEHE